MSSFNKVILLGNLTRDPECKYTSKGTAVTAASIACNRKWKNEAGEAMEEVTFVDCTIFGKSAETFAQYCRKGSPIFIEGRLRNESWEDKQSGQKRSKLSVMVESFQFIGGSRNGDASAPAEKAPKSETPASKPAGKPEANKPVEEDDVPF